MGERAGPPISIWTVAAVCSSIGLFSALVLGGSLWGYGAGIVGTLAAVSSLFVDRTRQTNPDYDYSRKWFRTAVTVSYWVGTLGVMAHIVRYAIMVGVN